MGKVLERRAIDAFRHGVGAAPTVANDADTWGGLSVCEWRLPWIDGFELQKNDDFVIAHHSNGSRKVRAACEGPWSTGTSIPGRISVIPPGRRVEYEIAGKVGFWSVHIPRSMLGGLSESPFSGEHRFHFAFENAFASSCIEILLNEARKGGRCNFPYVHAVTRSLLLHLLQDFRDEREDDEEASDSDSGHRLDAMLDFIDTHLDEPLRLDALAGRAGVSRAHFIRRFRSLTGMTPHRYLTLRRIEKAKELLKCPRYSLADIAMEVGFANQSHFTQVFHSTTEQTPGQFRRSLGVC